MATYNINWKEFVEEAILGLAKKPPLAYDFDMTKYEETFDVVDQTVTEETEQ